MFKFSKTFETGFSDHHKLISAAMKSGSIKGPAKKRFANVIKTLTLQILNPIQDGEAKKVPPSSFSPISSTNIGIIPHSVLTFSFNLFATQVQNFKTIPSASPKLISLNQEYSSKELVFLVKSL